MAKIEVSMPRMGESVAEATLVRWLKNEGDRVKVDEVILEIATDKVDSEVVSNSDGLLVKRFFKEEDVVKVGELLAIIESESILSSAEATAAIAPAEQALLEPYLNGLGPIYGSEHKAPPTRIENNSTERFFSPLVRSIAASENISKDDLLKVKGTGQDARVTKQDLLNYLEQRSSAAFTDDLQALKATPVQVGDDREPATPFSAIQPIKEPVEDGSLQPGDEILKMDRMRKLIAEHMVHSKTVAAHVTSFIEADVTSIVKWRDAHKEAFLKREKEPITYTPIFIEAVARCLKELPLINSSTTSGQIIVHKAINIGMATALPSGNLIVPVIKNADQKNLTGLTKAVNDLAVRARQNRLTPDEINGGTFTVTNLGTFGNIMGTPIINQPEVAILALGTIEKKPAVMETAFGDVIAIRQRMYLSLSYDHRVVDGSLGGTFLKKLKDYLEAFDALREL